MAIQYKTTREQADEILSYCDVSTLRELVINEIYDAIDEAAKRGMSVHHHRVASNIAKSLMAILDVDGYEIASFDHPHNETVLTITWGKNY